MSWAVRTLGIALACALALASVVGSAFAQGTSGGVPNAPVSTNARYERHMAKCRVLLGKEDWSGALPESEAAYAESPQAGPLINQAYSHEGLGRFADAVRVLELALTKHPYTMTQDVTRDTEDWLNTTLRPKVGYVTITVEPPGASVTIDGKPETVQRNGSRLPVDPGAHKIEASLKGHAPDATQIAIKKGENIPVALSLRALRGHVVITVEPKTALVTMNGEALSAAALQSPVPLSPGVYKVEATLVEYAPDSEAIEVKDGVVTPVSLTLSDLFGTLRVIARSPGSKIEVDGKIVGTGRWEGRVAKGSHPVRVIEETLAGTVKIDAGELRELDLVKSPDILPPILGEDFRGFYLLVSGAALIPLKHPVIFASGPFTASGASSGGFFGARGGYRLSEYAGLEGLLEYGGISGPENGAGDFSYALRSVHAGALVRTYSPGDPVRFVGTLGGGAAVHLIEYDGFATDALGDCGDPVCPSAGVDWFLINEVGGEVAIVDGLFLGLSAALYLVGTSGVDDFSDALPDTPFRKPYGNEVLPLFGPRLYLGYGFW